MEKLRQLYFPHDFYARLDTKVMKVRKRHGPEGYGVFWMLLEKIAESGGCLECDYEALSFEFQTSEEIVESIVKDFDLFGFADESVNKIFSKRMTDQLEQVEKRREDKSRAGKEGMKKRWNKNENNNTVITEDNANVTSHNYKEKEKEKGKEKGKENKNNLSSTTDCDSTENLENIEGKTENFGEMTVDVVDENIPLVNADKQSTETDNDFYMMFKNDAAAIEQMCIFTHKDRTAIMNFLIEFEAQCKYDGKFDKSYNDFKNHFRNWVNKKVSVRTSMSGKTVTRHNPNLRPGQCEYIDSDGRRRCADTNALIPDDAPPRPGNGSRWISSTKKWIPAGI